MIHLKVFDTEISVCVMFKYDNLVKHVFFYKLKKKFKAKGQMWSFLLLLKNSIAYVHKFNMAAAVV